MQYSKGIIFEEKPPTLPAMERVEQSAGVVVLQDAKVPTVSQQASLGRARERQRAWHRPERSLMHLVPIQPPEDWGRKCIKRLVEPVRAFTEQLLPQVGWVYDPLAQGTDYLGESEAAGFSSVRSVTKCFAVMLVC